MSINFSPEASSSSSSSSSSYHYRCTASHHKTLNVLGKVKNFAKLSFEELCGFCSLAKNEKGCENANEAAETLAILFGWKTASRISEIENAWNSINDSQGDAEEESEQQREDIKVEGIPTGKSGKDQGQKINEPFISSSSVPIIIRNNSWEKKVLLCEVDDPEFNMAGDSGAIGRISADPTSLLIDVKGRQYKGQICAGPTIMLLNLAAPVGQPSTGSAYQQTARVEVLTNEYCQLTFKKDLLGSMMGLYTGMGGKDDDDDEEEEGNERQNKKRGADDDSDNDDNSDNNEDEIKKVKSKIPKISTITNRTRVTTKKRSSKKKPSKAVKPKK